MTRREAEALIYIEMAESLESDLSDAGSWIYHGNYLDDDLITRAIQMSQVHKAATRIAKEYRELHEGMIKKL
jgi:hypothetical protein